MIERINLLLKAKNITARQFAEEIGIQPSGMSHILSGRNNPSLDFVMKVIKRWPEVNINWLMFGNGEMYDGLSSQSAQREPVQTKEPKQSTVASVTEQAQEFDLFTQPATPVAKKTAPSNPLPPTTAPTLPTGSEVNVTREIPASNYAPSPHQPTSDHPSVAVSANAAQHNPPSVELVENRLNENNLGSASVEPSLVKKKIVKMIVLYDDHSFAEYYPE